MWRYNCYKEKYEKSTVLEKLEIITLPTVSTQDSIVHIW